MFSSELDLVVERRLGFFTLDTTDDDTDFFNPEAPEPEEEVPADYDPSKPLLWSKPNGDTYTKQSDKTDANGKRLKNVNGYLKCLESVRHNFYDNGKHTKFSVLCGNTRKCERCRNKMIDQILEDMSIEGAAVPLYCHLIDSDPKAWTAWRKKFLRNKSDCDHYWRFPMQNGQSLIVSTIKEYDKAPRLTDMREQVTKWVLERGDSGNVSASEPMKNCSNAACSILISSRRKVCPECGATYAAPVKVKASKGKLLASVIVDHEVDPYFESLLADNKEPIDVTRAVEIAKRAREKASNAARKK